jgi:hypothetical protein
MPRYFFHISNKQVFAEDCEGTDLPDLHVALEHVQATYRQLALKPSDALGLEFTIADSSGRTLLTVPVPEPQHPVWVPPTEALTQAWRSSPAAASGYLH